MELVLNRKFVSGIKNKYAIYLCLIQKKQKTKKKWLQINLINIAIQIVVIWPTAIIILNTCVSVTATRLGQNNHPFFRKHGQTNEYIDYPASIYIFSFQHFTST